MLPGALVPTTSVLSTPTACLRALGVQVMGGDRANIPSWALTAQSNGRALGTGRGTVSAVGPGW